MATSTAYAFIYCALKRNQPELFPQTALPAFIGGCVWALAMVSWFVANADLSEVIAFVSNIFTDWTAHLSPSEPLFPALLACAAYGNNGAWCRERALWSRALWRD
jgi:hypothetical protein